MGLKKFQEKAEKINTGFSITSLKHLCQKKDPFYLQLFQQFS